MNINNPTLSSDAEAGFRPNDDRVLSAITQDHIPTGNGSNLSSLQNNHEVTPANGENDRPNNPIDDRPPPLSDKRKKYFTICWCSFVMFILVFSVVVALTLSILRTNISLTIPIFEQKTVNYTQEKNESFYVVIKFSSPNLLSSYSFHEILKIRINYYLPRSTEPIYFASIVSQGADQFKVRHGKVNVTMLASGLPGLLQQNKSFTNLVFYVYFEFSASCRGLCYEHPYYLESDIDYAPSYWPNV